MTQSISGVILAGGEGRRFNKKIKAKIEVGSKPIISRMLEVLNDIFEEIIIVTNQPEEFTGYGRCRIVGDIFEDSGPLGGIHSAMVNSMKEALFVFAGDMPFPDRGLIADQIEYFKAGKCRVLVPRVGKEIEPLHAIYSRSVIHDLELALSQNKNSAVRDFLSNMDVTWFDLNDTADIRRAFTNINTPGELNNLSVSPD